MPPVRIAEVPGAQRVNDTSNHTAAADNGPWQAIQALDDTVFATLTASNWNNGVQQTNVPLPAGSILYGHFTQLQLTSGDVAAYKSA